MWGISLIKLELSKDREMMKMVLKLLNVVIDVKWVYRIRRVRSQGHNSSYRCPLGHITCHF